MWAAIKLELSPVKAMLLKAMEGAALTLLVVRVKVADGAGVGTTGHPPAEMLLDPSSCEVAV
jgi:hypothetical protein